MPGCRGDSDDDDVESSGPLYPLFLWALLLGGKTGTEAVAEIGGTVAGEADVVEVRWTNETTGEQGLAAGTVDWTARVPVVPGTNFFTVTVRDRAGAFESATERIVFDGTGVVLAP